MVYCDLYCYIVTNSQAQQLQMHIISIGLNHTSAPVNLRERIEFNEEQFRASLARVFCGHLQTSLAELIIISTCNRTEIYAASNQLAYGDLEAFLSDARAVPGDELHPYLYHFQDVEAARHLFDVGAPIIGDALCVALPRTGQVVTDCDLNTESRVGTLQRPSDLSIFLSNFMVVPRWKFCGVPHRKAPQA